ncbi:MAG: hypothetical protein ACJ780_24375 [Solirubrobacteraceae bacterium]
MTFVRLVQCSMDDQAYAQRIWLVRSFDLRVSPELGPYLVVLQEECSTRLSDGARSPSAWQLTLTAAGMVAVITDVVVAACAGLALVAVGIDSLAIPRLRSTRRSECLL